MPLRGPGRDDPARAPGRPKRKPRPRPSPNDNFGGHGGAHEAAPGPPPRPKPRPPANPNDNFGGHGGAHEAAPGRPAPPAWVLQRQRQLRAAGYPVPVDGVWGARSQRQWARYEAKQGRLRAVPSSELVNHRRAELERLRQQAAAGALGAVSGLGLITDQRAQQHEAKRRRASFAELTGTFEVHDQKRLDAQQRREASAQTRIAVQQEQRHAQQLADRARRKPPAKLSLDEVVALTTDPLTGQLDPKKPGDVKRVQLWLRAHGHPQLKVDGVFGRTTFEALLKGYNSALARERAQQQHVLVDRLYKSGVVRVGRPLPGLGKAPAPGELLKVLQHGGFTASMLWVHLLDLSRDRGVEYQAWKEHELGRIEKVLYGPLAEPALIATARSRLLHIQGAPAVSAQGAAHLAAIADSKTFAEARRRLTDLQKQEEALRRGALDGAKHHSWWKGALDYGIVKPGEFLRHEFLVTAQSIAVGGPGNPDLLGTDHLTRKQAELRASRFEALLAKEHPWINLAWELTVDPLNLLPGVGTIGRFGAAGAIKLERVGYAIARGGELVPIASLRPLTKGGLALALPARAGRVVATEAAVHAHAFSHLAGVEPLVDFGRQVTRLKTEAIGSARQRVNVALRHGFRAVAPRSGEVEQFKITAEMRAAIDAADGKLTGPLLPRFEAELHRAKASLFVDDARSDVSNIGAMLEARAAETFRVHEVQRYALDEGRAAFQRKVAEGGVAADARAAFKETYREVIRRAGTYVHSLGDPDLARILEPRVRQRLDDFRYGAMRSMQNRLERHAADGGYDLFDDAGRWLGRDSDLALTLKRLAADSFDVSRTVAVKNARFGRFFSVGEAEHLIQSETEREVGRLRAWYSRELAAGRTPFKLEELNRRVDAIEAEVRAAWSRGPEGWHDTRAEVQVSALYARHLSALYGKGLVDAADIPEDVSRILAQLTGGPEAGLGLELDDELVTLGWAMGGFRSVDPLEPEIDQLLSRFVPHGVDRKRAADIGEALNEMSDSLSAAYARALPAALRKEYALWQAFAEAQGAWGRTAYRAVSGSLSAWVFLTLPFRPGWVVRNVVDNAAKVFVAGARDPRLYFLGAAKPGAGRMRSVFEDNVSDILLVARGMDRIFGTDVAASLERITESFWQHSSEVLGKIFDAHAIPVPERAIEGMRFDPLRQDRVARPFSYRGGRPDPSRVARFKDGVWELMASRPESYFKRVLYRHEYTRVLRETGDEVKAFHAGVDAVEKHLFDYSQETILEHNLRFVFPFVQFWRKNSVLWTSHFINKPWLPTRVYLAEQDLREHIHADLPAWTRRYFSAQEVGDGVAKIPALGWLGHYIADQDVMYDPLNFFSFAPLYRAFKNENPLLPADKAGWRFIAPFVDAINDWGLSMNPLLRKPLELAGVFNYRAWQAVFPQTPVIQAFTRKYLSDRWPDGLNLEAMLSDETFGRLFSGPDATELIARNFNQYVQMEMANQAARGERVSRAAAEHKIQDYFLMQNVLAYFSGAYVRRMTPQDLYLYQLGDALLKGEADYLGLSAREQKAYQLWKRRKVDRVEFDRYVSMLPLIQAYYRQSSYESKEAFKQQHPEILAFVEPAWAGKGIVSANYVETASLVQDTEFVMAMFRDTAALRLAPDVRKAAEAAFVTPELRAFWSKNDTPGEIRERHLRLLYYRYVKRLSDTFFAIPEGDYEAKSSFLEQHPVLGHWWQANNTDSDDYKAIINGVNATLRERYFEFVDAKDWDGAHDFLHRYPFIFEFTKAANKVSQKGDWVGGGTQHSRDYLAAKPSLDAFFALPESERSAWLRSGSKAAQIVRSYFAKYAHFGGGRGRTMSQHARDYLRVKSLLDRFFGMPKDDRMAWLDGGSRGAGRLLAYFRKYAHPHGHTQHAQDFLEVKPLLDRYFKLTPKQRSAWLHGGSKDAAKLLDYFKRYGKFNKLERAFLRDKQLGSMLRSQDAELNQRLAFWRRLFALTPDQRPAFIAKHADDAGVFVYGPIGAKERVQREAEWLREAFAHGASPRAAMHLYVKPLLDFFFTLKSADQKRLFLAANPELAYYLDQFAHGSPTGNKRLDKLVEGYFKLPPGSAARSAFLRSHPHVQDFFDAHSSKAERAMRNLLEVYFELPVGTVRRDFLRRHPEISAYFDKRKLEHQAEGAVSDAFLLADPRLREFWRLALNDITTAGHRVAELLRTKSRHAGGIDVRRDRRA